MYKTLRQVRISLLINALNKRALFFFSGESYFIKAIKIFFPVFAYPDINTQGVGDREFSTVMQTLDVVSGLHNCRKFSQPLSCLYQAMQTRKFFCLNVFVDLNEFDSNL